MNCRVLRYSQNTILRYRRLKICATILSQRAWRESRCQNLRCGRVVRPEPGTSFVVDSTGEFVLHATVQRSVVFITGTDTGIGKTVLAVLLLRYLRSMGAAAAGLKPVCSGGRSDARALAAAMGGMLALDEINPWHFRATLAPLLAARREKRTLSLAQVVDHVRRLQRRFPVLLIEGAGGLLSPLGEDFDSRDLITALSAHPIVVCPNRLGAVNQALLVLAALPARLSRRAHVVLTTPERSDPAARSNPDLLRERLGRDRVHVLPRISTGRLHEMLRRRRVRSTLDALARQIGAEPPPGGSA